MRNTIMAVIAIGIMFFLIAPVNLAAEENEFLNQFEQELVRLGYSAQERTRLMTTAREYNWQNVDGGFGEMAGLALQVCLRENAQLEVRAQIELVYHLAAMHAEMKALGFTEQQVARIAFGATREFAAELRTRTRTAQDNTTGNGDMIRDRIRSELCKEGLECQEAKIMERIRSRVQKGSPQKGRGFPS